MFLVYLLLNKSENPVSVLTLQSLPKVVEIKKHLKNFNQEYTGIEYKDKIEI